MFAFVAKVMDRRHDEMRAKVWEALLLPIQVQAHILLSSVALVHLGTQISQELDSK